MRLALIATMTLSACFAPVIDLGSNNPPSTVCDGRICAAGCCTQNGACVTGGTNSQCGTGGVICATCGGMTNCTANACTLSGDAGFPPGTGTVIAEGTGNALPPAWIVTDATVLAGDGRGVAASNHIGALVALNVETTSSSNPCPLLFTAANGNTFCDGFDATDLTGHVVIIDTWGYLGGSNPPPGCVGDGGLVQLTSGETRTFSSIVGAWQNALSTVGPGAGHIGPPDAGSQGIWVLSATQCADLGFPEPGYVGTGHPPNTTDVKNLILNFVVGISVGTPDAPIHGVVTARWTALNRFGFQIEDPQGGPLSAIRVERAANSTSTSEVPNIGDYVAITNAMTSEPGGIYPQLNL